jgi:hypothetical protein
MIWQLKDKNTEVKTCFAFLPRKIDSCIVWLSKYYKVYDEYYYIYHSYPEVCIPHLFLYKEDAEQYLEEGRHRHRW